MSEVKIFITLDPKSEIRELAVGRVISSEPCLSVADHTADLHFGLLDPYHSYVTTSTEVSIENVIVITSFQ